MARRPARGARQRPLPTALKCRRRAALGYRGLGEPAPGPQRPLGRPQSAGAGAGGLHVGPRSIRAIASRRRASGTRADDEYLLRRPARALS